jgi:VWFA-related protein
VKRALFCVLVLAPLITLLWTLLAWSQSAGNPNPNGKLRVAVVVSDAKGALLPALQSDDFTIEVAGKTPSGDLQIVAPWAAAGKQEQPEPRSDGSGLVVVVIDTVHTRWRDEKDLRAGAMKYLSGLASRNAPVTLFVLDHDGNLNPVHEYRSGSATLAAALELAGAELQNRKRAAASPEVDAETRRLVDFCKGNTSKFAVAHETERGYPGYVLAAMETVARYASTVPGRKSLVWVSSMIPFEVEEKQGRVATLSHRGIHERALLKDYEVSKLQPLWKESIGAVQRSEIALYPVAVRTDPDTQVEIDVLHAMASLARMTGGRELLGTGDPFPQLGDLTEGNRAAYDVLVAPEDLRVCRSDWCTLKISVSVPGAHVLAPSGFFRDASLEQIHSTAADAASEPESGPYAIPFTVTWKATEDAGKKKKCLFVITFGPKAGIPSSGSSELKLDIAVTAMSDAVARQTITFSANSELPPAMIEQIKLKGFALSNAIELQPGEYELRFVVRDKFSGRSGVVKVPLKVS